MITTTERTGVAHPLPVGTCVLLVPIYDEPREVARICSADYHASWVREGDTPDQGWSYVGEVETSEPGDDGLREFTGDQIEGFFAPVEK